MGAGRISSCCIIEVMSRYATRPRYGSREGRRFLYCLPCRQNLAERQWARMHGVAYRRKPLCQECASGQYQRMMARRGDKVRQYDRDYKARLRAGRATATASL